MEEPHVNGDKFRGRGPSAIRGADGSSNADGEIRKITTSEEGGKVRSAHGHEGPGCFSSNGSTPPRDGTPPPPVQGHQQGVRGDEDLPSATAGRSARQGSDPGALIPRGGHEGCSDEANGVLNASIVSEGVNRHTMVDQESSVVLISPLDKQEDGSTTSPTHTTDAQPSSSTPSANQAGQDATSVGSSSVLPVRIGTEEADKPKNKRRRRGRSGISPPPHGFEPVQGKRTKRAAAEAAEAGFANTFGTTVSQDARFL